VSETLAELLLQKVEERRELFSEMRHKIRIRGWKGILGVPKWVGLRPTKRPGPKHNRSLHL